MGLLKSTYNVPGIDYYDYRDSDYYGKYKYRVRFFLDGVRYAAYEKTIEDFMKRFNTTTGWKKIRKDDINIVTQNVEALKRFIDFRNMFKEKQLGSVRIEHQNIAFFSNDLSLLKTVETIKPGIHYDYTQVQTSNFVGVKSFVNDPKHKFRVYFKSKLIENEFIPKINDLLTRTKELHPSPSLKQWLKGYGNQHVWGWKYRYTNCNHFIDYDDESTLSYLCLMHGEYLGKRYKLEKRPEPI
jgi:hypothetical protein